MMQLPTMGKRLPTSAEWEYAARGGLEGKRYWDDEIDKANYGSWDIGNTTVVGSYPTNGYGLYDMAGNIYEWCQDWYDENYYNSSPDNNPLRGRRLAQLEYWGSGSMDHFSQLPAAVLSKRQQSEY